MNDDFNVQCIWSTTAKISETHDAEYANYLTILNKGEYYVIQIILNNHPPVSKPSQQYTQAQI